MTGPRRATWCETEHVGEKGKQELIPKAFLRGSAQETVTAHDPAGPPTSHAVRSPGA